MRQALRGQVGGEHHAIPFILLTYHSDTTLTLAPLHHSYITVTVPPLQYYHILTPQSVPSVHHSYTTLTLLSTSQYAILISLKLDKYLNILLKKLLILCAF